MQTDEQQLIDRSTDRLKCTELIHFTKVLMDSEGVRMTDTQWLSLVSHLSGMIYRSVSGEQLAPLDRSLFLEISNKSIEIAQKVVGTLANVSEDEVYLLSIHFESAQLN